MANASLYEILLPLLFAGPFGGLLYSLRQPTLVLPSWGNDGRFNPGLISDLAFGLAGAFVIFLLIPGQVQADTWMVPKVLALGMVGGYGGRAIIDTYLNDKIQELRKEVKEETSNIREQLVRADADLNKQRDIDGRALLLANQYLESNLGSAEEEAEMLEAIKAASPVVAAQIFEATRRARRQDPPPLLRVATVLRALIERNEKRNEKTHRPYAQLAYTLGSLVPPRIRESLDAINIAIEIRTQLNDRGYPRYDFHRALCIIDLDRNFANEQVSDPAIIKTVRDDLVRALALEEHRQNLRDAVAQLAKPVPVERQKPADGTPLEKYARLALWLHINHITLEDLGTGSAERAA